jgi:hypothetical protein
VLFCTFLIYFTEVQFLMPDIPQELPRNAENCGNV